MLRPLRNLPEIAFIAGFPLNLGPAQLRIVVDPAQLRMLVDLSPPSVFSAALPLIRGGMIKFPMHFDHLHHRNRTDLNMGPALDVNAPEIILKDLQPTGIAKG